MLAYPDICCLKRPFDEQSQPRVRVETDARLAILGSEGSLIELTRSAAHVLENDQNSVRARAARVQAWLDQRPRPDSEEAVLLHRTETLMGLGFASFDALDVASAEAARADVFVTCDDRLLATVRRSSHRLHVRVVDPLTCFEEVF